MKSITIFIIFLFRLTICHAQFNDSVNYHVVLNSVGVLNKTNEGNSYNLNNNGKFTVSKKSFFASTSHGWIYGRQSTREETKLTNNDFNSTLDANLFKKVQSLYYWGLGSYDQSVSLKIENRIQTGIGVGYNVVNRVNLVLTLSNGLLYEKSKLYDRPENEIIRNSFRVKFRFVYRDMIILDGTHFLQNSLEWEKDYIIKSITNLSFKLTRILNLTTSVNYNKMNLTGQETILLNYGLTLDTYF